MTEQNFCYWLHGYTEIGGGKRPTEKEWLIIKDHLDLVFNKVTPNRGGAINYPSGSPITIPNLNLPPGVAC